MTPTPGSRRDIPTQQKTVRANPSALAFCFRLNMSAPRKEGQSAFSNPLIVMSYFSRDTSTDTHKWCFICVPRGPSSRHKNVAPPLKPTLRGIMVPKALIFQLMQAFILNFNFSFGVFTGYHANPLSPQY